MRGRALHYVFKVADRKLTAKFYRDILGMKTLRHEEFSEGCEAACNGPGKVREFRNLKGYNPDTNKTESKGEEAVAIQEKMIKSLDDCIYYTARLIAGLENPYANRWSKSMVGYGPEDNHFVVELTYNYGVKSYEKGNDFIGLTIKSQEAIARAKEHNWPVVEEKGHYVLEAPGGYKFFLINEPQPKDKDPVEKVTLGSSNLQRSIDYWNGILGLKIFDKTDKSVLLGIDDNQAKLELQDLGTAVNRATAFGRIAFSCPYEDQPAIEEKIKSKNEKVLVPLISLDTPGKATVRVVILADPDGHEICFVDDEGFRELSKVDPEGDKLLNRYISTDKS